MTGGFRIDKRIPRIVTQVSRLAEGNYGGYVPISDSIDEIDGISAGLNELTNVLSEREQTVREMDSRIEDLLLRVEGLLDLSPGEQVAGLRNIVLRDLRKILELRVVKKARVLEGQ